MVTVNLPPVTGRLIQQYYVVWDESSTGCGLLLGPFYMDRDGNSLEMVPKELNFGKPYRPIDQESIAGQNPVIHSNAHGSVSLSHVTPSLDDAFLIETASPDDRFQGTALKMSDATGFGNYGNAYIGYTPQGNARYKVPVYWGYTYFKGMVVYDNPRGDYKGYGVYAGLENHVTGHSKFGYFDRHDYLEYRRVYSFSEKPYKSPLTDRWVRKAKVEETYIQYKPDGAEIVTLSVYDREFILIFTSPLFSWTDAMASDHERELLRCITSTQLRLQEPEDIFGTLVKEAVQSIRYISSNNIENLAELRDISSIAPPIKSIKKLVKKKDPTALADIYLWYQYALKPALSDIPELINTIAKSKRRYTGNFYRGSIKSRTYTAYGLTQTCESRAGVQFSVDPAFTAKMMLQSWGVDPSLSNAWDLVPFSFVIDWFAHVGDTLSNLDYELDIFTNTYDFEFINLSNKISATVPALPGYTGNITATYYHRWPLRSVPFTYDRQPSDVSSHILEGGALIVAKK